MSIELGVLPSGQLHCFIESAVSPDSAVKNTIVNAFSHHVGEGLFALAAIKSDTELPLSFRFWRDFACMYMTERCHRSDSNAEQIEPIELLPDSQQLLLSVPPMKGAEYLSVQVLDKAWAELDDWLCEQVNKQQGQLSLFLKKHASQWRQVGRVCFHLAENKNDPEYPFAFLATYASQLSKQGKTHHLPLAKALQEYAGAGNKKALVNLLSPIQLAAESSDVIKALVDSGDIYHPLAWTSGESYQFLKEVALFEACGVIVRLPDWWKKRARPQVSVSLDSKHKQKFNASAMLDFNVALVLGDQQLTPAEWKQLMAAEDGLMLLKGQWVEVDKQQLSQALEHWRGLEHEFGKGGVSFVEGMRLLAGAPADLSANTRLDDTQAWSFVNAGAGLTKILDELRQPEAVSMAQLGSSLKADLRSYQAVGVNWLWYLSRLGLGACLADDMGLGKTIQVIAVLLLLKKKRTKKASLLVLPASLLGNWKDELEKFAPSLNYTILHPSQTNKTKGIPSDDKKVVQNSDVVLTSYGMLLRQPWLLEQAWQLVVLDEAQAIKNPNTRQTKTVKQLKAEARIALTGTPVENRLSDLWSLFDFLCPGLLGSAATFKKFIKNLEAREQQQYAPLRRLLQPYILRRLKTDKTIISDLPDKTEVYAYCTLTKAQAALYQKTVQELSAGLQGLAGIQRRGLVLAYLLRFKQICNHPSQLLGDGDYLAKDSGKFARLAEICEEIASRQEKVLIFTQFREMTRPLAGSLTDYFGQTGLVLDGKTPVGQRKKMVDQFQNEQGPPFFVLSIKAGGTGLNLTAASHVIHFDRWWNPAVENQATDRAFRIGQKRNVLVHKFVCSGTIEEKIDALINEKMSLANDLLEGDSGTLLTEMSDTELLDLVSLDVQQIQQ